VRDAAERFRRVLGDDHPDTIGAIYNYGALLRKQGKHAEAEPLLRLAVGRRRRIFGEDHPGTLNATAGLAYALMGQGKLAEAEPLFAEVYRRTPGARMDPKLAANLMCGWGLCLDKLHRHAEAGPVLREAERRLKEAGLETPDSVRDALARSQTAATQPAP
jgi:tetratricopeptide (TPR) repeat protein